MRAILPRKASTNTSQSELSFRRIGISCAAGYCLTQLSPQPTEPLLWTFPTLYISNKNLLCLICLTSKYFPQRIPPSKGARVMFRNTQSLLWTFPKLHISNKTLIYLICLTKKYFSQRIPPSKGARGDVKNFSILNPCYQRVKQSIKKNIKKRL
jgi:hypothetical protein